MNLGNVDLTKLKGGINNIEFEKDSKIFNNKDMMFSNMMKDNDITYIPDAADEV